MLQKNYCYPEQTFSNLSTRLAQRLLGSSTSKIVLTIVDNIHVVSLLNSFIKKRMITKSGDFRSNFSNGQASKPLNTGHVYCLKVVTQLPRMLFVQLFRILH